MALKVDHRVYIRSNMAKIIQWIEFHRWTLVKKRFVFLYVIWYTKNSLWTSTRPQVIFVSVQIKSDYFNLDGWKPSCTLALRYRLIAIQIILSYLEEFFVDFKVSMLFAESCIAELRQSAFRQCDYQWSIVSTIFILIFDTIYVVLKRY